MKEDFTEVMSERTIEELIKITTIQRSDYQAEAVLCAEKELEKRDVNVEEFESTKDEIIIKEEENQQLDSIKVKLWVRLVHFIVDSIALFVLFLLIFTVVFALFFEDVHPIIIETIMPFLFIGFYLFYYVFMEYKYQQTFGKMMMKTKVLNDDGSKPKLSDIFGRTFCRLIPFDRISFFFAKNGFHDSLSSTIVVKEVSE